MAKVKTGTLHVPLLLKARFKSACAGRDVIMQKVTTALVKRYVEDAETEKAGEMTLIDETISVLSLTVEENGDTSDLSEELLNRWRARRDGMPTG